MMIVQTVRTLNSFNDLLEKNESFIKLHSKHIVDIKDAINCYQTINCYPDAFWSTIKYLHVTERNTIGQLSEKWIRNQYPNAYGLDLKPPIEMLRWILEHVQ